MSAVFRFTLILADICYHLACTESHNLFSSNVSLTLSTAMCLAIGLEGGFKRDLLHPTRVLALLYLAFFPLFGFLYVRMPELQKWYGMYFSLRDFERKLCLSVFDVTMTLPIFVVGFKIGRAYFWAPMRHLSFAPVTMPATRVNVSMCMLTVLGALGMLLYAQSLGGVGYLVGAMGDIAERKSWRGQGNLSYYLGLFLITAPPVAFLSAVYDRFQAKSAAFACLLVVAALPVLIVTQAAREKAMLPVILILLALFYYRQRSGAKKVRLARLAFLGALLAVVLGGAFYAHSAIRHQRISSRRPFTWQLLSDFNRIDISMVMHQDYFDNGNQPMMGTPFLSYLAQPFARLFGTTPIPNTSAILGEWIFRNNRQGDPGAPLAGELYVNFGFMGYLGFLVAGFFFSNYYTRLRQSGFEFWTTLMYVFFLYIFMVRCCITNGLSESTLLAIIVTLQIILLRWIITVRIGRNVGPSAFPGGESPKPTQSACVRTPT